MSQLNDVNFLDLILKKSGTNENVENLKKNKTLGKNETLESADNNLVKKPLEENR